GGGGGWGPGGGRGGGSGGTSGRLRGVGILVMRAGASLEVAASCDGPPGPARVDPSLSCRVHVSMRRSRLRDRCRYAILAAMPVPVPVTELRTLHFGHSPDADDAYMFYGFHTGKAVIDGCRVEHVLEDIQSLNVRAIERADLEITACSAHAYAHLADRYAVLACGASFGWGYGPVLVAREALRPESLSGKRVAIPGRLTTAALLLRTEYPDVQPVEVRFDDIPRAVRAGEVDAGVIIHESQLTYTAEGLHKVLDFGELWQTRDDLPVPLGLDVVRREL